MTARRPKPSFPPYLFSRIAAAAHLDVSPAHFDEHIEPHLPSVQLVDSLKRYRRDDLEAFRDRRST